MAFDPNTNASNCTEVAVYSLGKVESTFNQNILSIFKTDKWNDVTFVVGPSNNSQEIGGCRVLFACHSQVFDTMLFGKMSESQHKSTVIINDVSSNAFEWFKKYCYGLNPSINGNNVCEILQLGDKYLIEPLSQACMTYIEQYVIRKEKILNIDQFWNLLNSLHKLKLDRKLNELLSSKSLTSHQWAQLFANKTFLTVSPEVVQLVIKMVNQQRITGGSTDRKDVVSIERVWYHLIEWCKENLSIGGNINGDGGISCSQVDIDVECEDNKQENKNNNCNDDDDDDDDIDASRKWCGIMKRYFVSQNLIDFKQFDGAFYMQFIDQIAKYLMPSDEIIDVMRYLLNGAIKISPLQMSTKDLEMSEWKDNNGKLKDVIDLKWDRNNHADGIRFDSDYTIEYPTTQAICVANSIISPKDYQVYEWEITTHAISNASWLGYVNASLDDSVPNWNYFVGNKQDSQWSIGIHNMSGNLSQCGTNALAVHLATSARPNDRFKFCVNFNDKTVALFQNDIKCGIIEKNIDRAIIPAASNNMTKAKYSIRFVSAAAV